VRAYALGASAAVLVVALTSVLTLRNEAFTVDFEHAYESAFVDGFHPRERAGDTYFRWTRALSTISVENLPSRGEIEVEARLKVIRPAGSPLPTLSFSANGATVHRAIGAPGAVIYHFRFPSTGRTLRLGIESDTFEASGGRSLGVQALSVRIVPPDNDAVWLRPALWLALAVLLVFASLTIAGLGARAACFSSSALGVASCLLVAERGLVFSGYPLQVALVSGAALALVLVGRVALDRIGLEPRDRRAVLVVVALSFLVKLGAMSYPLWLSSDALFQANRSSEYAGGNWYPTSVTQHDDPFRIPYPVSLFVLAEPVARLGVDRVAALEWVVVLFEVLAGGALVWVGLRWFDDRRAGILSAVLFHVIPIGILSLSAGNFTNIFAVSSLTLGFACVLWTDRGGGKPAVVGASVLSLLSVTAHFGSLIEGAILWPAWAVALWWLVPPCRLGSDRGALAKGIAVSLVVSGLYYAGYASLVAEQWQRALGGGGGEGASIGEKLALNTSLLGEQIGWVVLAAAAGSAVTLLRVGWFASALHGTVTVWIAATGMFFLLDMLSSLQIRYWYQALPLFALLAGSYVSRAFDRGWLGKIAAVLAMAYISWSGASALIESLFYRYH